MRNSAFTELRSRILPQQLEAAAAEDKLVAVIFITFPTLKEINATRGYAVGDLILERALSKVAALARNDDCLVVTSGSKFCLILPLVAHEAILEMVLCRLDDDLSAPYEIDSETIFMPGKLGAGFGSGVDIQPDDLLATTELALATVTKSTSNWHLIEAKSSASNSLNDLQSELRSALEQNKLQLYLQPQVLLDTGACVGFEALTRWPHQNRFVSPDIFIPYAERSELIGLITRWTLHNSLRQLKALDSRPGTTAPLSVSLNVSGRCIADSSFLNTVGNALAIWDVSPERLTIELTETAFLADLQTAARACNHLKQELGVKISLDDFGMGFSGLEILQKVDADELKLDKSFIAKLCSEERSRKIVSALIKLADSLNISTVAEGIEDPETRDILRSMSGHLGQGYLFAKPLSENDVLPWLQTQSPS